MNINRDSYDAATRRIGGESHLDRWDIPMDERTFIGLHIPKCAGTSLLDMVRSGLPAEEVFQNTSIIQNFMGGREDFLHLFDKSKLRFVWGHSIHEEMLKFFGPKAVLMTGLREPIDRFRSNLRYTARMATKLGNPPPDFAKIMGNTKNPMCRFINRRFPTIAGDSGSPADRAMKVINACNFVYFSENFDETTRAICNVMGIGGKSYNSNVAPEGETMEFDIDLSNHRFDIEMYERARERFTTFDPVEAFGRSNPILESFVKKPLNINVLRNFLWESSYDEYKSWRALDKVIKKRTEQAEQFKSEIDYYKMRMEGPDS